jgi:hypothetical protein
MKAASLSIAMLALLGLTAFGQKSDPIEAAKATQRIADQKAEILVRKAIDDAERLAKPYPDKAAQFLRMAQTELDLSGGISTEMRRALTASLQKKLAIVTGKPLPMPGIKLDPAGPIVKAKRDANREKYEAEVKAVREGIEQVKQLQDANQMTAANRLVAQLQAKYPDNPAVLTLAQKDNFANAVALAKQHNELAQQRVNKAFFQVGESALPAVRDVEFPKDWKDRTKNRKDEIKLTDKEKKIIEALDKPVTFSAKDKPLDYLLQEISTAMDLPLLVDERSLRDLDIDLKKLASLDSRGVSARTALRQVLGAQGLTYVIKSETIQIMTVEKARETLATRAYYLGDVVQGVGPFGGGATWGPFLDYQQTISNVTVLMDAIQDSVDPLSWKKRGGPGTITFHFPSMSIIVRASSEVHAALGSKLGGK